MMLIIYETILSLYKEKFQNSTNEFKAGFKMAMSFLEIGIRKSKSFNANIKVRQQEREITKLKTTIDNQKKEINNLIDKLNRQVLILPRPIDFFKSYLLDVKDGEFEIIINADKETLMVLWFSFLRKATYKTADECKSKFLMFLTTFSTKGFIAYKDSKTYNKEHNYDS